MNKTNILLIAALVVIIIGGMWYVTSNKKSTEMVAPAVSPTVAAPTAVMMGESKTGTESAMTNVKEFTVTAENFSFAPSTITVKKGDKVRVTLKNNEGFHDFVIDELNVATKKIGANQTDVVEFTADKTGSFEYYCSVGNHRQMGMKGTLVVQ